MGIFTKGINPMAFGTPLLCPHPNIEDYNRTCRAQSWKQDHRNSTPFRIRYICRKCGKGVVYDITQYNPQLTKAFK